MFLGEQRGCKNRADRSGQSVKYLDKKGRDWYVVKNFAIVNMFVIYCKKDVFKRWR